MVALLFMYKGIYDFPEELYHKAIEENDLSVLGVEHPDKFMELMKDQLIDEFGTSDEYGEYMSKVKAFNDAFIKFHIDGDASYEQFVQMNEAEIERIEGMFQNLFEKTDKRRENERLRRSIQTRFPGRKTNMTVFSFYLDVHDIMKEQEEREMEKLLKNGGI